VVEGWERVSCHSQLCLRRGWDGRTEPLYPLSSRYSSLIMSRNDVSYSVDLCECYVLCVAGKHAGRYMS